MAPQLQCLYPEAKQSRLHLVWPKCLCCCLIAKLCPTLCDPMSHSLPGSSVHGISQAGMLEWTAISFFRGSSQSRNWIQHSCLENPMDEGAGSLQSMWSWRVGHDCETSLSLFSFMHWRRKWQPTPMFLPGESQGRGSLVGCHQWGRTESDTTEAT